MGSLADEAARTLATIRATGNLSQLAGAHRTWALILQNQNSRGEEHSRGNGVASSVGAEPAASSVGADPSASSVGAKPAASASTELVELNGWHTLARDENEEMQEVEKSPEVQNSENTPLNKYGWHKS